MKTLKKMTEYMWKYTPMFALIMILYTEVAFASDNKQKDFITAWKALMNEYSVIVAGVAGLGALTSMLVFMVHMFQLASIGSAHPTIRRKIINDIMISAVCTALLGGVGLIYVIVYQTVWFG
ncbi:hypothetical protein CVD28_04675 [Bacillus sp. M6-12]|uniref:hypothetical protein n=1 Tax=Bacillus sp. M6-12 TaxID=2054166 RepID=UPI000C7868F2|nr:hypothetical protein [Bacillus sp. M6-12]PLS19711.1 hypothetical protein CVD28_04675 [Bacillus sp. M6-12]